MRSDVPRWNWLKCTVWSSVALYSSTGMLTRPKLIDPFQTALAISGRYPPRATQNAQLCENDRGPRRSPDLATVGTVRVVVLSDTHAPRFWKRCPPAVAEHLRSADLILHGG